MLSIAANQLFRTEMEIKKSRFITSVRRVDSEPEARSFISAIRTEFPDARHNCTAFRVSLPDGSVVARSSDDGEPSGTAGMPMLEALGDFSNLSVVVTRYFGGIKLGTGGLVRAYTSAVKQGLEEARKVRISTHQTYLLELSIQSAARLEGLLAANGYQILTRKWTQNALLELFHPLLDQREMEGQISAWLAASATLKPHTYQQLETPL